MIAYRDLIAADRPAITEFLKWIPEFAPDELPVAEEVLDDSLDESHESGYYTIVAVKDGCPVGYVTYGNTPLSKGNWEIYWAAVNPTEQGRGIGRELMYRAEEAIKGLGGWQITLETSSTPLYEKTRRFHMKCGFKEIVRIPDFYDRDDDLVIFFKKLE
ncbi:GNAT family N-acetyltransferase [Dehalogenimonas etheniformans]|uniref:N-acetyltransferase n=1 Tax=Dehalogenimonas etheniformans TaxID=1536648 RepID=A0A2P5P913_9CHLR|nr:GNAT family N-acetyltransferase [Dehalogenimonas etheniformans]PPD58791.1 N-acetyltransferase [Dehalogenimonas etheniformans]QNT76439.1 GNAT family N-acetyltransferase [Dehalogenimonas etheniformans]